MGPTWRDLERPVRTVEAGDAVARDADSSGHRVRLGQRHLAARHRFEAQRKPVFVDRQPVEGTRRLAAQEGDRGVPKYQFRTRSPIII